MTPQPDDMALGSAKARVTVIEYASVGCPHCAVWNAEVFPALKAKFIDTGQVRFVVREMTTGDPNLAAAGFMLARCAAPAKYFQVVDAIYHRQADLVPGAAAPAEVMHQIASAAGITDAAFDACLSSQAGLAALNARVKRHEDVDKIDSTPTFFVNGQRFDNEQDLNTLSAAIGQARQHRGGR
jgi:protein-disulfide isomerase